MQLHVNKLHPDMVRTCADVANCQTPKDHRCGTRLYLAERWLTFRAPRFPCKNKNGMKKKLTLPLRHFFFISIIDHVQEKGFRSEMGWKRPFFSLVEPFLLVKPGELFSEEKSSPGLTLPTVRQLDVGQGDLTRSF